MFSNAIDLYDWMFEWGMFSIDLDNPALITIYIGEHAMDLFMYVDSFFFS